jgi:Zn-dependent protease with chaperone function
LIRLAELAAWMTRTVLLSLLLTTLGFSGFTKDASNSVLYNVTHNYVYIYTVLISLSSLLLNILYFDFDILFSNNSKNILDTNIKNTNKKEYICFSGIIPTLIFLLQGVKVKGVNRNLIVLSGWKKLYLSSDTNYLQIENIRPIKKFDYIVNIILILIILVIWLLIPFFFIKVYDFLSIILYHLGVPTSFSRRIITIFGAVPISFHIYSYAVKPYYWNYTSKAALLFRKKVENIDSNFQVYESPILPFYLKRQSPLGLADVFKKQIYINPIVLKDETILQYVIAHEEGHIYDFCPKILKIFGYTIPWVAFIIIIIIDYLLFVGELYFNIWLIILGLITVILMFVLLIILREICEERAENYAIKKLGLENVIKALQKIAYSDILPDKYKYHKWGAEKQLERIKRDGRNYK